MARNRPSSLAEGVYDGFGLGTAAHAQEERGPRRASAGCPPASVQLHAPRSLVTARVRRWTRTALRRGAGQRRAYNPAA